MISLIYNDREINFTENILKISGHINTLYEDNNYNPILDFTNIEIKSINITDETLDYFILWFNELDKLEIVKYEKENVIFKPSIFKECDIETLINIFNFGFYFQIRMLCETIAFILSKNDIIEHEDKYYILTKQILPINEKYYIELCKIQLSLAMMMLKYMSKKRFKKQPSNVQSLIKWKKIHILDLSNINEYVILPYDKTEIYNNELKKKILKKVIIPDIVTSIGEYAFYNCTSLKEVIIPDSVKSIGERAFAGCASLTKVVIPNSVTSIDDFAFGYCESLKEVVIPNSVKSIGKGAFDECESLEEVVIPDSVKSIGYRTFCDCYSLKEVIIPNSVTYIGEEVFCCCGLTKVVIPDSVTSVGKYAFKYCNSLKEIVIPEAQRLSITNIDESVFSGCTSLTKVIIPDSVTSIGEYAFYNCKSLKEIIMPDSVTSIGEDAFYNCKSLKEIIIPNSVTSIGNDAFYNCKSLEEVTLPKHLEYSFNQDVKVIRV